MQLGLSIAHHDHEYVERRGGHAFFSHLRGAPARARYREAALRRAEATFEDAIAREGTPEELCGAGLLVLQRAVLAAEDLAVLLHALADDDPEAAGNPQSGAGSEIWPRLVNASIADQMTVFSRLAESPESGLRAFRLPTDAVLAREDLAPATYDAARRLRDRTAARWTTMLERVAGSWMTYGTAAKSTMHGFAAIAGRLIVEPPGAGVIGARVRPPNGPFVVMVNSRVEGSTVESPAMVIEMQPARVRDFRRNGSTAVKLAAELCAGLADGIARGYGYGIPPLLAGRLSGRDQEALAGGWGDGESEGTPDDSLA